MQIKDSIASLSGTRWKNISNAKNKIDKKNIWIFTTLDALVPSSLLRGTFKSIPRLR